jgi:hypothetical protein
MFGTADIDVLLGNGAPKMKTALTTGLMIVSAVGSLAEPGLS